MKLQASDLYGLSPMWLEKSLRAEGRLPANSTSEMLASYWHRLTGEQKLGSLQEAEVYRAQEFQESL